MARSHTYVLIGAVCLYMACSRDPKSPQGKAAAEKAVAQIPTYSAASIAPSGAAAPAPLAPGRVASIYGRHLGSVAPCHGSPEPNRRETPNSSRPNQTVVETQVFPTTLCDTEVVVGGTAAGLLYVSDRQINFKVPQSTPTEGDVSIRVVHKGQAGPSILFPVNNSSQGSAKDIAERMWSGLQSVQWEREYRPDPFQCLSVPARQGLRGGLFGHAFYCAQTKQDVMAESFYYPVDPDAPRLVLLRADFRPAVSYPELSAEVEELLITRLNRAFGAPATPDNVFEIGATRPEPGRSWTTGEMTIFLHRNQNHVEPAGVRRGVVLIAVRREVLDERRARQPLSHVFPLPSAISPFVLAQELLRQMPENYFLDSGKPPASEADRGKEEDRTQRALFRLLRQTDGGAELRAASLVAADDLVRRLGSLLAGRSIQNGSENLSVAPNAAKLMKRLSAFGIQLGGIGHYSGDLTYNHTLLQRAWKEYPDTIWGQRAFLVLQRLACALPDFGCKGLNCFLQVVEQGERFLEQYPETTLRREQIYHLALAYETWWSLSEAKPDDPSAEGAKVSRASGERARVKAIALYEELLRTLPESAEAQVARAALPRLKLKLGTGERTFFCFSC